MLLLIIITTTTSVIAVILILNMYYRIAPIHYRYINDIHQGGAETSRFTFFFPNFSQSGVLGATLHQLDFNQRNPLDSEATAAEAPGADPWRIFSWPEMDGSFFVVKTHMWVCFNMGEYHQSCKLKGTFFAICGARKSPALAAVCKEFSNYSAKDMSVSTRLAKDRSYGWWGILSRYQPFRQIQSGTKG